jgi:quercetin 2,3-dioxygenase
MSNLETAPAEVACAATTASGIDVLSAREVPLGGPRAIRVRRSAPSRDIGAR